MKKRIVSLSIFAFLLLLLTGCASYPRMASPIGYDYVIYMQGYHDRSHSSSTTSTSYSTITTTSNRSSYRNIGNGSSVESDESPKLEECRNLNSCNEIFKKEQEEQK